MGKSKTLPKCTDNKGNIIKIVKEVGRGGEGTVYEIEGKPDLVLKIYHKYDEERSKKITLMSSIKNERLLKYTAWPVETVRDQKGNVIGLIMPIAKGKEVHKLYSPKSRLTEFDNVSLPFLIHTAANIARSFALVHESGHVIGDVNHGNIIVSSNGTIKLIDCDSFQVHSNGKLFLCKVGVSTHQPPELQSKSLKDITRTANHDNFGLAVIIFQILFMGRHPFSGRYLGKGDMPIEKAIEQYRFAYGKNAKLREMQQPPGTLPLEFYSNELAELFENAFIKSNQNSPRPTALEWINVLEKLNKELVVCSQNKSHTFSKYHKNCPWCEYERKTGIVLFSFVINSKTENDIFQLDLIWKKISNITPPYEQNLISEPYSYKPTEDVIKTGKRYKKKKTLRLSISTLIGILSTIILIYGDMGIFSLVGVISAFVIGSKKEENQEYAKLSKEYDKLNRRWNSIIDQWNKEASTEKYIKKLNELKNYKTNYEQIPQKRALKIKELEKDQRKRQLNEYLDRYYIQSSQIDNFGPSRKSVLQSYGIETARDITRQAVLNVPGFGPSLTQNLLEWRKNIESKFIFDPMKGVPKADLYSLEKELSGLKRELEIKLSKGEFELNQIKDTILARRKGIQNEANECLEILEKTKANVDYLRKLL